MKKMLSLVLAVLMMLALVACAGTPSAAPAATKAPAKTEDKAADTTTDAADEEAEEPAESLYATPVVVSMNVMNAERNGNHIRNEIIKEKFNLTFDYIPTSWGDWDEKVRTWISTDDAPDLIWMDLKGSKAKEYKSWARQGAFAEFKPEYFVDTRPNLKNVFENALSIDALSVDGALYAWPSLRDNPPEADGCYTSHWCYRRDWAQAVGLYKEGDIYTWEEWIELLRAVIAEDPGANGTANAGLVMATWAFPHAPALFVGPPAAEGNETCSYIQVDGEYVWPPSLPEYRTGVKWTYDMYQEGLIYPDNMVFSGSEPDDMVRSGLAFGIYNVTGSLNSWTEDMIRDGVIEKREDFGIAIVSGWDGVWYMTQTEDYWTTTYLNHKLDDDSEKLNRILDFWEYLKTTEGIRMRQWGGEGIDYNVTGPAITDVELLWEFDEATQSYINPFTNIHEFNEANGSENGRTILGPGTVAYQYEERDRLWKTYASGAIPAQTKKFDYTVSFGAAENKDKYGGFEAETKERLSALLAQKNIDVEAEWDKFVAEMMPRVQLVLDELNGGKLQ